MTSKQTYWLRNATGDRAFVEGKEERDRWVPLGWADSTEPAEGEQVQVWLQHAEHGGRAKFPLAVVPTWQALGWNPSPPPEPVDVLHDEHLVDQADTAPAPAAPKPAAAPAAQSSTSAAAGDEKKENSRG